MDIKKQLKNCDKEVIRQRLVITKLKNELEKLQKKVDTMRKHKQLANFVTLKNFSDELKKQVNKQKNSRKVSSLFVKSK